MDAAPKSIRETLCIAQAAINHLHLQGGMRTESVQGHVDTLGEIIAQIDEHRPVGNDGKHGELHTPTCGCEDHVAPWSIKFGGAQW